MIRYIQKIALKAGAILKNIINKFHCGNSIEFMSKMPSECVDLILTSPPYDNLRDYQGYNFDFEKMANEIFRVIKKGGVIVWVVGDKINKGNRSLTSFKQALYFQSLGLNAHDIMIYAKKNTPFMRSNAYTNAYEYMFIFSKGSPKTFNPLKEPTARSGFEMLTTNKKSDGINKKVLGQLNTEKTKTNIWSYAVGLGGSTTDKIAFKHPAVFPENLAKDHILSWSNELDLVLDPMCGSGTTCKMAYLLNRNFIGVDVSKEYIEISKERLSKYANLFGEVINA
ncbi:MAG: site-specific DNA-methyltransferase [Campylobacter sp.]|uniref:DNA-methyltransferase n=1 Tax=Campylobacter sp. TaxID=205 RepID=UPI0029781B28|nr:site-specific DNA-methyltransferase [Campylobacter sp.]MDD7599444.1 site-specific DNA-methyltransferase [Campylobacteraceae bacterium]MDY5888460.1 site-specific DNA-methyltransferase [Campylobacter sp.]